MREIIESEGGLRFLEKILRYLSNTADGITPDELKNIVKESFSQEKEGAFMTIAEILRKEGFELGIQQGVQQGLQQGVQQGIREGLTEAIELGLSLKFGDKGLEIMPLIQIIQDCERLRKIKNAIKTVKDLSELKTIIAN
jgi:flagellar biosynthesis/type III secretory pathway protein FliH